MWQRGVRFTVSQQIYFQRWLPVYWHEWNLITQHIYERDDTFSPKNRCIHFFFAECVLLPAHTNTKKIENKCLKKYVNQHFEELRSYKPTVKTGVNAFCCFEFDLWPSNTRFFFFFSFYLLIPQTVIKMCEPNTNKEMSGYIFYHCISAKTTTRINPRYVPQPVVPLGAGAVNERLSDNNILKL